ncbi:MAG: sugar ABC transporter permease [Nitrososphaerota archaeon]
MRKTSRNLFSALLLLSPFLILYSIFVLYPAFQAIYWSLYETSLFGEVFVGARNYLKLLTGKDEIFTMVLRNTGIYALYNITGILLALFVALLINSAIVNPKFRNLFHIVILLPMVISWVTLGLSWNYGIICYINLMKYFTEITLGNPLANYVIAPWALGSIILWAGLGYNTLLIISSLRGIPKIYIEAALLDGAGGFALFRYVTLPLLKPILLFLIVGAAVGAFNIFDPIATVTFGGPGWASSSVAWYASRQLLYALKYGYASTLSVVAIAVVLTLSIIQFRLFYAAERVY